MDIKKLASFDPLVEALKAYGTAHEAANEANNTKNAAKKKAVNAFTALIRDGAHGDTKVIIDGAEYKWDFALSKIVDPRAWYKLWQDGEITEEQFFKGLSVGKGDAENAAGKDQILMLEIERMSDDRDLRRAFDKKADNKPGISVVVPEEPKPLRPVKREALQTLASTAPKKTLRKLQLNKAK